MVSTPRSLFIYLDPLRVQSFSETYCATSFLTWAFGVDKLPCRVLRPLRFNWKRIQTALKTRKRTVVGYLMTIPSCFSEFFIPTYAPNLCRTRNLIMCLLNSEPLDQKNFKIGCLHFLIGSSHKSIPQFKSAIFINFLYVCFFCCFFNLDSFLNSTLVSAIGYFS